MITEGVNFDSETADIPYSYCFKRKQSYYIAENSNRYMAYIKQGYSYNNILIASSYTRFPYIIISNSY